MRITPKTRNLTVILLICLTLTLYASPFLPPVHAQTTALTVSPISGRVRDSVGVNGTVQTVNGSYRIFFDSAEVRSGAADNAGKFTNNFIVPQAINGTHVVTLQDVTSNTNNTANFTVITSYSVRVINMPAAPNQLQEGAQVEIEAIITGGDPSRLYERNITVTLPNPLNSIYYNATPPLLTNQTGTASSTLVFPRDFLPAGAHTNFTGTYQVKFFSNKTTIAFQTSFFIGLTDATTYHRRDIVNIRAANYTKPNENATVIIKLGSKILNQTTKQAVNGTVVFNWQVPANASMGSYKVTVTNATPTGTRKQIPDAQNFTITGFPVNVQATNLNNQPLDAANATVYEINPFNQSQKVRVGSSLTNSSGWTVFTLERGNYTFKAFWKNVLVNETTISISDTVSLTLVCQLTTIELNVIDEKYHEPMPFVFLNLTVRYVSVTNQNITETPVTFVTNATGQWMLTNQLVVANYTVLAYRTGFLFWNKSLPLIPQSTKVFIQDIVVPLYSLTVHAADAKQEPLVGYPIEVYAFAGGLYTTGTTNAAGNVTFDAVFGVYRLRLLNTERTIVLNETLYSLINQTAFFTLSSSIFPANLSVRVVGYGGQPLPGVTVKVERESITPATLTTDSNGVAFFQDIVGGDCFVSVYLGGAQTPSESGIIHVERSTTATFTLARYVSIFGLLVEIAQVAVLLTIIVLVLVFAFFMLYRRRKQKTQPEKPSEKTS